jgi:hypothetical protein
MSTDPSAVIASLGSAAACSSVTPSGIWANASACTPGAIAVYSAYVPCVRAMPKKRSPGRRSGSPDGTRWTTPASEVDTHDKRECQVRGQLLNQLVVDRVDARIPHMYEEAAVRRRDRQVMNRWSFAETPDGKCAHLWLLNGGGEPWRGTLASGAASGGSGAAPDEVCGAELATDEGWVGRAQFQAGTFELRYVVLRFVDPVGEEADFDVVGDLAVVGDREGASIREIATGSRGEFVVLCLVRVASREGLSTGAHELCGHETVAGVQDDSLRIGSKGVDHVGSVDASAFIGFECPGSDQLSAEVIGCGGSHRGVPFHWVSYGRSMDRLRSSSLAGDRIDHRGNGEAWFVFCCATTATG